MTRTADQPLLFRVLAAVQDIKLELSDRLLLLYLAYRQGRNGKSWPAVRTVAKDLGLSPTTVQNSIERLCQAGVVEKFGGKGGRANRYVVRLGECTSPRHISGEVNVSVPGTRMCQSLTLNVPVPGTESLSNLSGNPSGGAQPSPASPTQGDTQTQGKARRKSRRSAFVAPTVDEVAAYAESQGEPDFPAQRFVEYYSKRDWHYKNGKPMKDWRAAVRTWVSRDNAERAKRGEPPHDGYSQYGTHLATEDDIRQLVEAGVYPPEVLQE